MNDITHLINMYRECIRGIWNLYLQRQLSQYDVSDQWDLYDEFNDICILIFSSLVLRPIDRLSFTKAHPSYPEPNPLAFLYVVPSAKSGVQIDINRNKGHSHGYWDHPVNSIKPKDADLHFVDVFDFDSLGFRNFQYYLVKVANSSQYPDLIGRYALADCNHYKILFEDNKLEKAGDGD